MRSTTKARLFHLSSWAVRIVALVLSLMVILLSFVSATSLGLSPFVDGVTEALPPDFSGVFVILTPFGGVFRGDFALCALILFLVDWWLSRLYKKARNS